MIINKLRACSLEAQADSSTSYFSLTLAQWEARLSGDLQVSPQVREGGSSHGTGVDAGTPEAWPLGTAPCGWKAHHPLFAYFRVLDFAGTTEESSEGFQIGNSHDQIRVLERHSGCRLGNELHFSGCWPGGRKTLAWMSLYWGWIYADPERVRGKLDSKCMLSWDSHSGGGRK